MANINIVGEFEITIGGQSFGLTCPIQNWATCCTENGTYTFFYSGGGVSICPPGSPPWNPDITWADLCGLNTPIESIEQVFCDPCANRCCKDCGGTPTSYSGNYKWLFTQYVNRSPNPIVIPLKTYTVTGGYDPQTGKCGENKLCVNGTCVCCNDPEAYAEVNIGSVSKDIEELLKAHYQPYISVPDGEDPTSICSCYCPGCGPNIQGWCGEDLNFILNIMREVESQQCK